MSIRGSIKSSLYPTIPNQSEIRTPQSAISDHVGKPQQPHQPLPNQQTKSQQNPNETATKPQPNPQQIAPKPQPPRPETAPKRGPVGYIYTLPSETQEQILQLLNRYGRRNVSEHLAKPALEGLGVLISEWCLGEFHRNHKRQLAKKRHTETASAAKALLAEAGNEEQILTATLRLIKVNLLDTITDETLNLKQLETLHRIRLTDIASERLNGRVDRAATDRVAQRASSSPSPVPSVTGQK